MCFPFISSMKFSSPQVVSYIPPQMLLYIRKNDKLVENTTIYILPPEKRLNAKRWTVYNSVFEMNKFLSLFDHRKIAQSVSM